MCAASSIPTFKERTAISKALSYYLRHGGEQSGIHLDSEGWANVSDLQKLARFKNVKKITETLSIVVSLNIFS